MTQPAQPAQRETTPSQDDIRDSIAALVDSELNDDGVKRTTPDGDVVEEETGDDATPAPPAEKVEEPEDTSDPEETEDADDSETKEGEAEETISSLADLSSSFEMEEADFLKAINVDESTTLADIVSAHLKAPENVIVAQQIEVESESLREKAKALDAQREEYATQSQEAMQGLAALTDSLLTEVEGERATDWESLKVQDPQTYMIRWTEHQQKKEKVQEALTMLRGEAEKQQEQQKAIRSDFQSAESAKLYQKMPEWTKDDVRAEAFKRIEHSLRAAGFEDADFEMLDDHRVLLQAHKAMLWDELQAKGQLVKKRIKTVPKKIVRAGVRRSASQDQNRQQRRALRKRLGQTGSIDDVAILMREHLT